MVKDNNKISRLCNQLGVYFLFTMAAGLSVFQIWQIITARLGANTFRPIHMTWILLIVFLNYPSVSRNHKHYSRYRLLDALLALLSAISGVIILTFDYNDFSYFITGLNSIYFTASLIFFLLVIESTRRAVGPVMTIIITVFIAYNLLGRYLPGQMVVKSFSLSEFFSLQIYSTNGVFGLPLGIAAEVVFVFILFGALLESTKAGDFFTTLSVAATGKFRGGPAKASVLASALLGSISGSAIANAVTTGTFTIPLMKKIGYKPTQAAGIEASASTGGQIMPPIMGAGAFIMAQFTGIPYSTIVIICFTPGILYFFSTLLYVHLMAVKLNIPRSDVISKKELMQILKRGGHSFLSIAFILVLLLWGFTPALVGIVGCGAVVLVSWIRAHTRLSLSSLLAAFKKGAELAVPVSVACAAAGIIVGVVGQTGLGLQMVNFIISFSQGLLFPVFLMTAFMALILGMGLPVTASYILLSIVTVPVFTELGIATITAHIIVFWLSQTSNVTPPIALAAFAAAGVAKASPMRSALQAFKLSNGLLLIPAMMLYSGLIYTEGAPLLASINSVLYALIVIVGLAAAIEGYLSKPVSLPSRVLLIVSVVGIIFFQGRIRFLCAAVVAVLCILNFVPKIKKYYNKSI